MKILSLSFPAQPLGALCESVRRHEALREGGYGLALFPELVVGGYQVRDLWLSRDYLDHCDRVLASIAQLQGQWQGSLSAAQAPVWLVGAPHRSDGRCHNAAIALRQGKTIAVYHKRRLARAGVFEEHRYFEPGDQSCVLDIHGVRCAVLICEDVWVDEVVERASADADLLLALNASPFEVDKQLRREQRIAALAQRHRRPFVLNNAYGFQDELAFEGISYAYSGEGRLLLRSDFLGPGAFLLDYDKSRGLSVAGSDAVRPLAKPSEQLWRVLSGAIRAYAHDNGLKSLVLGLSGGIDSAVCLCLAVEALGASHVHTLMIVGPHTSDLSLRLAGELAARSKVDYRTVDICGANRALLELLRGCFGEPTKAIVKENLQARLRCCLLAGLANQKGALLLNTTNKSEAAAGYGTLYGDLAGGIAPLLDVLKGDVYRLARHINRHEERIPAGIITRAPSAELAEGQTDEASLMPYSALDGLIHHYLGLGREFSDLRRLGEEASTAFSPEQVERFCRMAMDAEYKRRQAPMGFKTSPSAYIIDRRFPLSAKLAKGCLPKAGD